MNGICGSWICLDISVVYTLNHVKSLVCLKITDGGKEIARIMFRESQSSARFWGSWLPSMAVWSIWKTPTSWDWEIPWNSWWCCSFPKQKNVVGPCWSLPITVFCWGFSLGCLISQLGSLLHDLSSPDFPGKCQLSPNLATKDKECFPKSTGRFFSWQNILLRGESGWHRFLSCAFKSLTRNSWSETRKRWCRWLNPHQWVLCAIYVF